MKNHGLKWVKKRTYLSGINVVGVQQEICGQNADFLLLYLEGVRGVLHNLIS